MFWPHKKVTFFHSNLLLDNCASFTSSTMKDLRQKWKVKLIFRGAYRLSGTGIVECLEIVDVGCNLKQFDGLTWLTLTPRFTTDLRDSIWLAKDWSCKMLKYYQFKTHCNGDLHSSKTANILLPGIDITKYRWTPLYVQNSIQIQMHPWMLVETTCVTEFE